MAFLSERPQLSAGSILGRTFNIWARNFVPFTCLSLLVFSPLILVGVLFATGDPSPNSILNATRYTAGVALILAPLATATMSYGVFQQLNGTPASFGKCLRVGLSRLFPVIGVAFVAALLAGLAAIALVIPGLMVMCAFWVAVPASVVERIGVGAALSRSSSLTKGNRWTVFGVVFLLGVLSMAVSWITRQVLIGDLHTVGYATGMHQLKTYMLVNVLEVSILTVLPAVGSAIAYHDLRVATDGVATEQLAAVFD